MDRYCCSLVILFLSLSSGFCEVVYETGFEPSDGFVVGALPQQGWYESRGSGLSEVSTTIAQSGIQSIKVDKNSTVEYQVGNQREELYIDAWLKPPLSENYPNLAAFSKSSAVFIFEATDGIVGLDGNGIGGGNWVIADHRLEPGFGRMTLHLEFQTKRWSLYWDQELVLDRLGFKDNSVTYLHGLSIDSDKDRAGFLDNLRITSDPPDFLQPTTPTVTPTVTMTPVNTPIPTPIVSKIEFWSVYR